MWNPISLFKKNVEPEKPKICVYCAHWWRFSRELGNCEKGVAIEVPLPNSTVKYGTNWNFSCNKYDKRSYNGDNTKFNSGSYKQDKQV